MTAMRGQGALALLLACAAAGWAQSFSFRPGVVYPAGTGSVTAAQGDFNGDGKLDIAVGNAASANISIFLGNGDGSFTAGATVALPGCLVGFVAAADFNHDSHTDLLAVCLVQNVVYVVPGAGNGKFGTPISTTLPSATFFGFVEGNFQNVAVGDFNNDGAPDLVIGFIDGNQSEVDTTTISINVMLNKGDGTFQAPQMIVSGATLVPTAVLVADFDRDGNQDIAVAGALANGNNAPEVEVFLGTGKGTFQSPSSFGVPVITALGAAAVADVNRDGLPDLILTGSPDANTFELCVLTGTGGGAFKQAFTVNESSSQSGIGVLAADLRGTGNLDLVEMVGNLSTLSSGISFSLTARPGNGDGTFGNPTAIPLPSGIGPWPGGMLAGNWTANGPAGLAFAALPTGVSLSGHGGGSASQTVISAYDSFPGGSLVVLLNGIGPAPALSISQKQLQFNYVAGGVAPAHQSVAIGNSGTGALTWAATASAPWLAISPASGTAPSSLSIAVLPGTMSPATYTGTVQITATGATGSPQTITVTLVISPSSTAPTITGVVNGASFLPGFESGSWVTIQGVNLSNTNPGRIWTTSEVVNGNLPQSLDNTSVTIDGKPAFVYYISPTQLNVQAPSDSATGNVSVVVTNNGQQSAAFSAQLNAFSPAFFLYAGTTYAIASHFPDYALVGNPSAIAGTIAAHPGDVLILWATGFGPTSPATPAGVEVTGAPAVATQPTVTVGGVQVSVVVPPVLSPGSAALYQVAIQLPASVPTGLVTVQASVAGVTSPTGINLFVSGQ